VEACVYISTQSVPLRNFDISEVVQVSDTLYCMEPAIEHTLSDVLRTPNPVLQEAEQHDILIRRRGQAEDMILMEAKRALALRDTLGTFARLLHVAVQVEGVEGHITQDVNFVLPWTALLPEEDRRQFVAELTEMAGASADTGNYAPLAVLLRDWQATANVYANPAALKDLTEPLEEAELVPLPGEPLRRRSKATTSVTKASDLLRSFRYHPPTSRTNYPLSAAAKKAQMARAKKTATNKTEPLTASKKSAGRVSRSRAQRTNPSNKPGAGSAQ
jgi:hypothetical protein